MRSPEFSPGNGHPVTSVLTPLQLYLRGINELPLLTAQQERELARRIIHHQDENAREVFVRSNLRLVVNIAKYYLNRGMEFLDLIEEGNIGLLKALEGYDPESGYRFSTYASWWIKQSIKRALINSVQPIHIPAYMVEMIAKYQTAKRELKDRLKRPPTKSELATHLKLTVKKVGLIEKAMKAQHAPTQSGSDDGELTIEEMIRDENNPSPDEQVVGHDDLRLMMGKLDDIDERAARILKLRYGLGGLEPMTLKDIGEYIGLTRERVRQIEHEALIKMRALMEGDDPDANGHAT